MDGDGILDVGDSAPDFSAPLVRPDGTVDDVTFSTLNQDKPVLLVFYTVDFSPDCIREWCSFRDFAWFASNEEVRVVGISKSGPGMHKQFIQRLDLPFPMYSDGGLDVSDAYGVTYRAFGLSERSRRSCFLVDTDGTIGYRWLADHWLDPTRDVPPVPEIHDAVTEVLATREA